VFEILANHAPFVFALKPGPLRMRLPDGQDQYVAVGSGFLVVQKERTTVLARSAERPRKSTWNARAVRRSGRTTVATSSSDFDMVRAKASLQRALRV